MRIEHSNLYTLAFGTITSLVTLIVSSLPSKLASLLFQIVLLPQQVQPCRSQSQTLLTMRVF